MEVIVPQYSPVSPTTKSFATVGVIQFAGKPEEAHRSMVVPLLTEPWTASTPLLAPVSKSTVQETLRRSKMWKMPS